MKKEIKSFKDLTYDKKIVISKLVAEYDLFSLEVFPYTHCKARIWQEPKGNYIAYTNIMIKDKKIGTDGTVGRGDTEIEALDSLIKNLLELISQHEQKLGRKLESEDYEYLDCDDF